MNSPDVTQGESLTKRELEVIKCMADGCSDKQIDESLFISTRTFDTHKKHIREKLNLNSTAELVKHAIKNNIMNM